MELTLPALHFRKQCTNWLAQQVAQHGEPTPVWHANLDPLDTMSCASLRQRDHARHQCLMALKPESLQHFYMSILLLTSGVADCVPGHKLNDRWKGACFLQEKGFNRSDASNGRVS